VVVVVVVVVLRLLLRLPNSLTPLPRYHVFELFIILLFFAQVSVVLYHIHRQCTAEVFFVDWERAKAGGGRQGQGNNQSISAWRTILVANEWNKLQSTRRTSLEFTLVLVAFFLLGLDLQYSATAQPDLDDRSPGPINTVLRFCNTTWWYLLVTLAQFLYQWLIYERLFGDFVAQKFIDLCTIAKVSVIAMDEAYHGFYLHCDSPHANADDSMATLTQQLLLEENSERTARGLDPQNAPHLQTFELFASARWRLMWETYYVRAVGGGGGGGRGNSQFGGPRGGPGGGGGPNGGPNGGGGGPGVIEQMISGGQREVRRQMLQQRHSKAAAVEKVKQFLQEFFKKNLKNRDLDWKIVHPDGYVTVLPLLRLLLLRPAAAAAAAAAAAVATLLLTTATTTTTTATASTTELTPPLSGTNESWTAPRWRSPRACRRACCTRTRCSGGRRCSSSASSTTCSL